MRILHVVGSLNPREGGPSEGLRQFAQELMTVFDDEVEIACLDEPGADWLENFPCRIHALGPGLMNYRFTLRLVPWLREHATKYDAIIANGIWQYTSFAVWFALRNTGTPYFVYPHGMLDPWFKQTYPIKHLKKWLYWPWGEYRVLRDARAVFFTCEEERRLARESFWLYRCNERVVGYGTAAPAGNPDQQRELFLNAYPHLRGKRILLFLSRIHEKKGLDLLIRAFADVLQSTIDHEPFASAVSAPLHLVIAGPCADPAYLESLKQLAERQLSAFGIPHSATPDSAASSFDLPASTFPLTFLPMLRGDVKWGAFHAADAFVLPSHQENFGMAVAEALACGVPVLISNKVNIWREIEADGAGLVAEATVEGTSSLLRRWFDTSERERADMHIAASVCFRARFAIQAAAQSLLGAIQECLSGEQPPT